MQQHIAMKYVIRNPIAITKKGIKIDNVVIVEDILYELPELKAVWISAWSL